MATEETTPDLSPRESQLLEFAAQGLTDTAIAHRLGISEATVGTYWGRVRMKLGPHNRTELVAIKLRAESKAQIQVLREENSRLVQELHAHGADDVSHFLEEVLMNSPTPILVVQEDTTIECANFAFCQLFGYSQVTIQGHKLAMLIPEHLRDRHLDHVSSYFRSPSKRLMGEHLATPALHHNGTEFRIQAVLTVIESKARTRAICTLIALPN